MVGHRPSADSGVADACVEYLKREHKTPFMLVGSFLEPHGCCEEAREILKYQRKLPGSITRDTLPPLPHNFAIDPDEPEELQKHRALSPNRVHPVDETWNEDMWRYYLYRYYRFVETVDKQVGRVLDTLEAQWLADNTVIIFSSDHGDGMGSHQWNQKWVLYEESARIPFIISAPGNRQKATLDSKHLVAACLDLLPTVCDYAGARIPEHCQGKSLRPVLESPEPPNHHEAVFCEVQSKKWRKGMPSLVLRGRMVRTDRYKYIVYAEGARREQLFDLKEDRGETQNLTSEEKFKDVLEHHRGLIIDWCKKTEDKEFLPFLPA
jgi:arylsulfatase A-like enzyme